jgi:predicted transcriptional regulator of viral defense system
MGVGKPLLRALYALAATQGGYFTARQAATCGDSAVHLQYHTRVRNFLHAGHGLYRIPTLPRSEHDDLIRISLWSRSREGTPQAVVSHETALALDELSEVIPSFTHVTVPRIVRKRPPKGCVLHKDGLTPAESEERAGFRVSTPV